MKFSNKIVITAVAAVNIFTGIVLYLSFLGAMIPDALINCFFIFWGTEMLGLAGIRISKARSRDYEMAQNEAAEEDNQKYQEIIEQIKNLLL